jgi:hypothetical protein
MKTKISKKLQKKMARLEGKNPPKTDRVRMYWKEYQLTLKELQRSSWIWPRRDLQLFAVADSTPRRRREAASVPRSCFSASFIAPIRVSIIACRLSDTDAILSPAKRPFYIVSADLVLVIILITNILNPETYGNK